MLLPACLTLGMRIVSKICWQTIRQIDLTDTKNSWYTQRLEMVYSTIRGDSAGYKPDEFRETMTEMA
jgi:hypothetical protein